MKSAGPVFFILALLATLLIVGSAYLFLRPSIDNAITESGLRPLIAEDADMRSVQIALYSASDSSLTFLTVSQKKTGASALHDAMVALFAAPSEEDSETYFTAIPTEARFIGLTLSGVNCFVSVTDNLVVPDAVNAQAQIKETLIRNNPSIRTVILVADNTEYEI